VLIVNKAIQTITFTALDDVSFGADNFDLSATTDASGLSVSYLSSDESVATVSGSTVTIVGAGSTTITASQVGDATFSAASDVEQVLTVNKAIQTITFAALDDISFGADDFDLSATTDAIGLSVSYSSSDESVAIVSGGTVTIVGAGSTVINASQSGDDSYNAASAVEQALTVNKATQTITFEALVEVTLGDANFDLLASASSELEVSFISSDESVATISGNAVTIVGEGVTTITASQTGDNNYETAADVAQDLTVKAKALSSQSITFDAIEDQFLEAGTLALTAMASSGLDVSYEIVSGPATLSDNVIKFTGLGEVLVNASQIGNDNFSPADPVEQAFEVITVTGRAEFGELKISTYPNPVLNMLRISANGQKIIQVHLFDLNGQLIISKGSVGELDVSRLKAGQYVIRISTDDKVLTQKIIKQ
jgi:hypothetical protein